MSFLISLDVVRQEWETIFFMHKQDMQMTFPVSKHTDWWSNLKWFLALDVLTVLLPSTTLSLLLVNSLKPSDAYVPQ